MKWVLRATSPIGSSSWRMARSSKIRRPCNSSPTPRAKERHVFCSVSSLINKGADGAPSTGKQKEIRMRETTSNGLSADRRALLSAGAAGVAALLATSPTRAADTGEDTLDKIKNSGVFNIGV